MKTTVSPFLMQLANIVAHIPGMKSLLKPLYYPYKRHIESNRLKLFHENALSVLSAFDEVMMKLGIPYTVFAGTLLGAVREKGFIPHDQDIDTAIFYKDYFPDLPNVLKQNGFQLVRSFKIDGGSRGQEETYEKEGVFLDIFYIHSDAVFETYQCDFHPVEGLATNECSMKKYGCVAARRIEFPVRYEFVRIPFENIYVNAISNYEEWLRCRYGADYMIPNPDFSDKGDNPAIFEWKGVKAVFEAK